MNEKSPAVLQANDHEAERIKQLLRSALPAVSNDADIERDLWPAMSRHMQKENLRGAASVPWFDWALAAGLVTFAALAPRTIPVILYYL
jgi:hypothetical protein